MHELLQGRNFEELDELIDAATRQKSLAKEQALSELTARVETLKADAEKLGVNLKGYFFPKKEYPDIYANPNNPQERWNGRGPNPAWIKELLKDVPKDQWKEQKKQFLIL